MLVSILLKFFVILTLLNDVLSLSFVAQSLSYLSSPFLRAIFNKQNISLLLDSNYNDNLGFFNDKEMNEKNNFRGRLFQIFREEAESTNISKSNASKSCLNVFNRYLFGHIDTKNSSNISYLRSSYHIVKFLDDSSKSVGYLGSYDQCMYKHYKFEIADTSSTNETRSTYVVLTFDKTDNNDSIEKILDFEFNYYLVALCLPQGYDKDNPNEDEREYCSDEDYKKIVLYLNKELGDYLHFINATFNCFTLRKNPHNSEKDSKFSIFLSLLPFIFFLLQVIIVIFRTLIIYLIKKFCCRKDKTKENNNHKKEIKNKIEYSIEDTLENEDEDEYEKISEEKYKDINDIEDNQMKDKLFFKIINCLCFTENENELFNFTHSSTKFNNDKGLSNIRGIKGIAIIFMIIGFTFVALYNSPVKIYTPTNIRHFFEDEYIISSIVMIGVRYSPRIIISYSGYSLIFSYLSYLQRNLLINTYWESYSSFNKELLRSFLYFLIYQSHKYFLFVLLLFFERYSLYQLYSFLVGKSPIWKFFNLNILKKPSLGKFFYSLLMINYFIPFGNEGQRRSDNNLMDYFWLPCNEILFFLFGVILITIGFKKKYRIDIFILILIPVSFLIKILFSYLVRFYYEKKDFFFKKSYPTYYFSFLNYGRFMINPLFNVPYFLIGMFFGLTHFTIQKGIYCRKISDDDNENDNDDDSVKIKDNNEKEKYIYSNEIQYMPFLKIPALFVIWHRNQNLLKLSILLIIFIFIFFFFISIFYIFNDVNEAFESEIINFIYRFDIEFVIIFVQWGLFIILLKANNFVGLFLSNIYWTMISKSYFSFILIINTTLLFIFYQSENMIEINSMNILLYSVIGGGVTFIVTSLFYIFFELPYKRLIRLMCSMINNKKDIIERPSNDSSMIEEEEDMEKLNSKNNKDKIL